MPTPDEIMQDKELSSRDKLARMRKLVCELPKGSKMYHLAVKYCGQLYDCVLDEKSERGKVMIEVVAARKKTYVKPGEIFISANPYSEVCMHMKVAGKLQAKYITTGRYPMVQLLNLENPALPCPFSFPITLGEGGIYREDEGKYYYVPEYAINIPEAVYEYDNGFCYYDEVQGNVGPFSSRDEAEKDRAAYIDKLIEERRNENVG